jgi:hypothetical protein
MEWRFSVEPGGGWQSVQATYTSVPAAADEWVRAHVRPGAVLGLDCEWRPTFVAGEKPMLGTIQLATMTHALVYQFQYRRTRGGFETQQLAGALAAVLTQRYNVFVGMSIGVDLSQLSSHVVGWQDAEQDAIDLKRFGVDRGVDVPGGLHALAQHLLGCAHQLDICSRFVFHGAHPLTEAQCAYAAMDAWASLACFEDLLRYEPARPMPALARNGRPKPLTADEFRRGFISLFAHVLGTEEPWVSGDQAWEGFSAHAWPRAFVSLHHLAEQAGLRYVEDEDRDAWIALYSQG